MVIIADVKLTYEGRDITLDIAPFLTSFTFTDNSSGKADDISITLQDKDSLWLESWTPSKGDTIRAGIRNYPAFLDCGAFEADEISYSMPPHVLTVKAVSCAVSKHSRQENHNHSWEGVSLRDIALNISQFNSLELFYDAPDYTFERREQVHTPDLLFLESMCGSFGLNVKVSDGKLIIYSEEDYYGHESATAITPSDKRLISANFTSKSAGIYRRANVKYHHPVKNETYEASCEDSDEEGSERELEIYERVDSQEQAQQVAEKSLAKANSREITGTVTLLGNDIFMAGINITLDGFGMFSGKYFIEKVTHTVNQSGWTAQLSLKMGGESKKAVNRKKAVSQGKKQSGGGAEILADDSRGY